MVIIMPASKEPLGEGKAKITGLTNVTINEISKNGLSLSHGQTITCDIDSPLQVKALKNLEKQKLQMIRLQNY
jgi:hypothetical protein